MIKTVSVALTIRMIVLTFDLDDNEFDTDCGSSNGIKNHVDNGRKCGNTSYLDSDIAQCH